MYESIELFWLPDNSLSFIFRQNNYNVVSFFTVQLGDYHVIKISQSNPPGTVHSCQYCTKIICEFFIISNVDDIFMYVFFN